MLTEALSIIHNATTLLFGVFISAAFIGVRMSRRNVFALSCFSLADGVCYALTYVYFGEAVTEQVYPLIVHLPLALFLMIAYKCRFVVTLLSVLIAYLCCQVSNWVGILFDSIFGEQWIYYTARIAITVTVFVLLLKYVSHMASVLLYKPTRSLLIIGFMPFVYYLFDYVAGVYTGLLYSGKEVVVEFLGFVLCIFYIVFLFVYMHQYEAKNEAEQLNRIMEMKRVQSEREIKAIRNAEQEMSILRHDMRHFLINISSFIENGEGEKAISYINEITKVVDATKPEKYSNNELVNIVLSSHENEIASGGIVFEHSVKVPEKLDISDIDLTAILSNGIENAINAVMELEPEKRRISLDMRMNDKKLLISIKNTYATKPQIIDGLPRTDKHNHGFGTKSIYYVTEKLGGNCRFSLDGDEFLLQVVV